MTLATDIMERCALQGDPATAEGRFAIDCALRRELDLVDPAELRAHVAMDIKMLRGALFSADYEGGVFGVLMEIRARLDAIEAALGIKEAQKAEPPAG